MSAILSGGHKPDKLETMKRFKQLSMALVAFVILGACGGSSLGKTAELGDTDKGLAVYYSDNLHGRPTASGEPYDKNKMTAAHKKLPFGTVVRVTNLANRRTVQVKINDRGPFGDSRRIIDLSRKAAEQLDMIRSGVIEVKLEIVE